MTKSLRVFINRHAHPYSHPQPLHRADTAHSRYVQMLLDQDNIPTLHNILASLFVWLMLAGFLVFPGTFTTLQKSVQNQSDDDQNWEDQAAKLIVKSVRNIPLLAMAAIMCGISALGITALAFRHRKNYVWLVNKLFLPGMTNSLAGLVSTLIGVYTQQHGTWSITAKVTAIVEGGTLGLCGAIFLIFELALLKKVKESHGQHYHQGWPGQRMSRQLFTEKV